MNKNEYIVQPNEKGGYDLILGGVGLSAHEAIDLMNEFIRSLNQHKKYDCIINSI